MSATVSPTTGPAGTADWVAYDFAVLRAVPHPHVGAFVPVGVVVHARTREFLDSYLRPNDIGAMLEHAARLEVEDQLF